MFDEFKGSGKTQRQFCKENSLALSSFNKRFANQNKAANKKQPVFIATEIPNAKSQIEIDIGKCKIVITEFSKALLLDLVEVISNLVLEIYSRKIVAWEIWEEETGEHAAQLIEKAVISEKTCGRPVILHSDNGSPMKSATLLATLEKLCVAASYSRPRVSNDNPYSESIFILI